MSFPIAFEDQPSSLYWKWQKLFLWFTAVLASTILLKVGTIQYLELLYCGLIVILLLIFVEQGYRAMIFRPFFLVAVLYTIFLLASLGLSISAALRFEFYVPLDLYLLKQPVYITLARMVELTVSVAAMLYMAHLFRSDLIKARFTMRVYFWTGVISGVYSILSLPFSYAGYKSVGAYSDLHRLRGFYNEGGPYGLYVISVLVVGYALYRQGWESLRRTRWSLILMLIVFVLTYSKAAICAALVITALNVLLAGSLKQRLVILSALVVIMGVIAPFADLGGKLRHYKEASAVYERASHYRPSDPNFVYGRVAGAYIVPRMIAAHPLTGVGWGNYGTLRNAPEYRGAAVFVPESDDPGLGIFGLAADFGLPLLAFLLVCLFTPFFYLRSIGSPTYITNLALLQPIVHLFGAQLNVTYPWVVTAFALGLGSGIMRHRRAVG